MSIIRLAHNAVTAKLIDAPKEAKDQVSTLLSYQVEGAEHMAAFQHSSWSGTASMFDYRACTFPAGFASPVYKALTRAGHKVQLLRKPAPDPLGPVKPRVDAFGYDNPDYDYQWDTVERLLRFRMMIAQVATGGGKSRICKMAYARILRPTLFLTTRSVLMHQMKKSFETDMGIRVGVVGDGAWQPVRGMNVAMVQSIAPYIEELTIEQEIARLVSSQHKRETDARDRLQAKMVKARKSTLEIKQARDELNAELRQKRLSDRQIADKAKQKVAKHAPMRRKVLKLLEFFELVILEEAHESSSEGYYRIMKACKNAHYRLALTATPFMRANAESDMRLMAVAGPVGIRVSEKRLIETGILATPVFKFIPAAKSKKVYRSTSWQRAYKFGIVENEGRNLQILEQVREAARNARSVMILVIHTEHGRILKRMIDGEGLRSRFIYGKHEQEQREQALSELGSGKLDVLIGSNILDVGVDVPSVGMVVLAGGGKAEIALRQRIGRGLRAKKFGANVCLVVDFADPLNNHLKMHAAQRRAIIEDTPGFKENILPPGQDFDYEFMAQVSQR